MPIQLWQAQDENGSVQSFSGDGRRLQGSELRVSCSPPKYLPAQMQKWVSAVKQVSSYSTKILLLVGVREQANLIYCTDRKAGTEPTVKNGPEVPVEEAQPFSWGPPKERSGGSHIKVFMKK